MNDEQMKKWIDNASYEELLRRWRFSKTGDLIFQGMIGQYYSEVMYRKKNEDPAGAVAASKRIGWDS